SNLRRERLDKSIVGAFANKINGKSQTETPAETVPQESSNKPLTLREKFEQSKKVVKTDSKGKEEVVEQTTKSQEVVKTVSKEEFLKEYKEVDPDTNTGEEKKPKKIAKKPRTNLMNSIRISL